MGSTRHYLSIAAAVATAAATTLFAVPASAVSTADGPVPVPVPVPVTTVHITKSDHVRMPTRLRSGMREFVIKAAKHSSFQFVRPRVGFGKREAVRDIKQGLDEGNVAALRHLENNTRFLGGVNAGPRHNGHMWRAMRPGRYWALETSGSTAAKRILTVHVRGSRLHTEKFRPSAQVRAVRSIRWAKMPRAIPHQGVLRFANDSRDNHVMVMIKLAPGKTMRDFRRWVNSGTQGRPPLSDQQFFFGVLSPNSRMAGSYSQPRGKYVLLCFWPDADHDGLPHFLMGMYRGVRLT